MKTQENVIYELVPLGPTYSYKLQDLKDLSVEVPSIVHRAQPGSRRPVYSRALRRALSRSNGRLRTTAYLFDYYSSVSWTCCGSRSGQAGQEIEEPFSGVGKVEERGVMWSRTTSSSQSFIGVECLRVE